LRRKSTSNTTCRGFAVGSKTFETGINGKVINLQNKRIYLLFIACPIVALLLVWFAAHFILSRHIAENCEYFLSLLQTEKDAGSLDENVVYAGSLIIRSTVYGYMEVCYWLYCALIYVVYLICMNYLRLKYYKLIGTIGIVNMGLIGLFILMMAIYNPIQFEASLKQKNVISPVTSKPHPPIQLQPKHLKRPSDLLRPKSAEKDHKNNKPEDHEK